MPNFSAEDESYMALALHLGQRQSGRTGANPAVGCVIVKDGAIVGTGATADGGRPHAEAVALLAAGPMAEGACVYVTLEPCAHVSERGPPCAQSLVSANIARLVAALQDPDPRTAGNSFALLRAAGIRVDIGLSHEAARADLVGFLSRFNH